MCRKLTSIVWTINKESLQKILNESSSIREILPKLGLSANSAGSFITLKKRIYSGEFDTVIFDGNKKKNKYFDNIGQYAMDNKVDVNYPPAKASGLPVSNE